MVSRKVKFSIFSLLLVLSLTGALPILLTSITYNLLVLAGAPKVIRLGFLEWDLAELVKSVMSGTVGFLLGFFARKILGL